MVTTQARMTRAGAAAAMVAVLGGTLTACYTPLSKPIPVQLKSYPRVEAGCLLPDRALFQGVPQTRQVDLKVTVEADGVASKAAVKQSTGSSKLDEAFVAAALKCRYTPAQTQQFVNVAHTYVMTQTWVPGQSFTGPQRCFMPDYPLEALLNAKSGVVLVRVRFMLPGADAPAQVTVMPPIDPAFAASAQAATSACFAHAEAREGLKLAQWYEVSYTFKVE